MEKYEGNSIAERAVRKVARPHISIITVTELIAAIARREAKRRKDWEEEALRHYVILTSAFTVLEINSSIAKRAGILRTKYKEIGIEFSLADAVVLATAEFMGWGIITGGKQYEREWKKVTEAKINLMEKFVENKK